MNANHASRKMILGEDLVCEMDQTSGINSNLLVIGGPGTGKTESYVAPILLYDTGSKIVPVAKRSLLDRYAPAVAANGNKVLELNFAQPERSTVCYDPLDFCHTYVETRELANAIFTHGVADNGKGEQYWRDAASDLFCSLVGLLRTKNPQATFSDFLELFNRLTIFGGSNGNISTSLDEEFSLLRRGQPNGKTIACWNSFRQLPRETAGCVYGTLSTGLGRFFPPALRKLLTSSCPKVDIKNLVAEPTTLFVVTSPAQATMGVTVGIFYTHLYTRLFQIADENNGRLPLPVTVISDDFGASGKIEGLERFVAVGREMNLGSVLLLQSFSQLEAMYGSDKSTIIGDCFSTIAYLGCMNLRTCQDIARRADKPLADILNMPLGKVIVFRMGHKPVFTNRYPIYSDPKYLQLVEKKPTKGEDLLPSLIEAGLRRRRRLNEAS